MGVICVHVPVPPPIFTHGLPTRVALQSCAGPLPGGVIALPFAAAGAAPFAGAGAGVGAGVAGGVAGPCFPGAVVGPPCGGLPVFGPMGVPWANAVKETRAMVRARMFFTWTPIEG